METVVAFYHMHFTRTYQLKLNCYQLNCSYNLHKNNICNHLDVITKVLDTYYGKYENNVFLADFNAGTEETPVKSFLRIL